MNGYACRALTVAVIQYASSKQENTYVQLLKTANARQLAFESVSFFLSEKVLMRKLAWEALGTTASLYKPLDEDDVPRIADAALEVLE